MSIATLFKIGELSLLFGGDIENQSINLMPDYLFDNLSFIKSPHHTSPSSNALIEKLDRRENYYPRPSITTTTYNKHKLPNLDLVDSYRKYSDSFSSTGNGENGYGYGYIKTSFEIISKVWKEFMYGDAFSYYSN